MYLPISPHLPIIILPAGAGVVRAGKVRAPLRIPVAAHPHHGVRVPPLAGPTGFNHAHPSLRMCSTLDPPQYLPCPLRVRVVRLPGPPLQPKDEGLSLMGSHCPGWPPVPLHLMGPALAYLAHPGGVWPGAAVHAGVDLMLGRSWQLLHRLSPALAFLSVDGSSLCQPHQRVISPDHRPPSPPPGICICCFCARMPPGRRRNKSSPA